MNEVKYEVDFYGWTQEQVRLLREGRFAELDVGHVMEEIETSARGERRELVSHLRELLTHLLKWAYQPERHSRSWRLSVEARRVQARAHLLKYPSLKPQLDDIMAHAFRLAVIDAERQTRPSRKKFPARCPWSFDEATSDDFWPDGA